MTHYAKVEDSIVTKVIVAEAEFFDTFVDDTPGEWLQTSYSGSIRKNYAGVGHTYDATMDAFIAPQPYASWTLNDTTCLYDPPIAYLENAHLFKWDEDAYQADNSTGWVLIE